MFKKNTDRLIIIPVNFSCHAHEEHELVKYLNSNLPIALKRRTECMSCEIRQPDTEEFPVKVHVEFLLGLMEGPRAIYGTSHLLYLAVRKFEKIFVEIDGEKTSPEITDEGLKKLIKARYDQLKKEKE